MTTTQRKRTRGRLQTNLLKAVLYGGAIISTFLGGRLLSQDDVLATNVAPGPQLVIPEQRNSTAINISDAPIPELVMPVTRSRSSR